MHGALLPQFCHNESSIKYWLQKLSRSCSVKTMERELRKSHVKTTFEKDAFMTVIAHDGQVSFSWKFRVDEKTLYQKLYQLEYHANESGNTVRVILSVFTAKDELIDTMYFSIHPAREKAFDREEKRSEKRKVTPHHIPSIYSQNNTFTNKLKSNLTNRFERDTSCY